MAEQNADTERRKRWPNPPPKTAKCDASLGWSSDLLGTPVINRCRNQAVETAITKPFGHEGWFCLSCVESLAERGKVVRNSKKYPALIDGSKEA